MESRRPPPRSIVLKTARLVLRPSRSDDADRSFGILSDWEVTRNLSAVAFPPDQRDQQVWFDGHPSAWAGGRAYRFAVLLDKQMIGLADLDRVSGASAELGYWFGRAWWGNGYATEAARALIGLAGGALALSQLTAGHAADNLASGRVLLKLGFHRTGEVQTYSRSRRQAITAVTYIRACDAGVS